MFPTELVVAKSKLESEGIVCKVLDENTVQVHNFLSQAIGGVRLQVEASNLERARAILEENGLIEKEKETGKSTVEKAVGSPKFQRRLKFVLVALVSTTVVFVTGLFAYKYLNRPTDMELLMGGNWCVDYIVYKNQEYAPYTVTGKVKFRLLGRCSEELNFNSTGQVDFPGFNTARILGRWEKENNTIRISQVDTLDFLLERRYRYQINQQELILDADSLTIYCYPFLKPLN